MTISTTSTRITYQANGTTRAFSFSFPGGPDPDIQVYVTDPTGIITQILTNVQINLNPAIDPNPTSVGGNVVYPVSGSPLAAGNQITITRVVPVIQPTSIANQSVIYPPVIEQTFDYLTMEIQQLQDQLSRVLLTPITDTGGQLTIPGCPARANKFLGFDENCNPIAVGIINPVTTTNALRVPANEGIPPLAQRNLRPGTFITFDGNGDPFLVASLPPNVAPTFFGTRVIVTSNRSVGTTESGFLFQLAGNTFFDLSFGDPTAYDPNFSCLVFNADTYTGPNSGRAKRVMFNGTIMPGGLLWPGQWVYVFRTGNTWTANPRDTRWKPGVAPTFYVDPVLGHDDGTTDALATGAGAAKTITNAVIVAIARVDYGGLLLTTGGTIQLARGTYNENVYINQATVGGLPLTIRGGTDMSDAINYTINNTGASIWVDASCTLKVTGINFTCTGGGGVGVQATHGADLTVDGCRFGPNPGGTHITAYDSAIINTRNVTIAASAAYTMIIQRASTLRMSAAFNCNNGLAFTLFAQCFLNSVIIGGPNAVFGDPTDLFFVAGSGTTGAKYSVYGNSIIAVSGGTNAADNWPGNSPGSVGFGPLHGIDASMVMF